jgi:hypothetical protein
MFQQLFDLPHAFLFELIFNQGSVLIITIFMVKMDHE